MSIKTDFIAKTRDIMGGDDLVAERSTTASHIFFLSMTSTTVQVRWRNYFPDQHRIAADGYE
jgi:hypothetical protein